MFICLIDLYVYVSVARLKRLKNWTYFEQIHTKNVFRVKMYERKKLFW